MRETLDPLAASDKIVATEAPEEAGDEFELPAGDAVVSDDAEAGAPATDAG